MDFVEAQHGARHHCPQILGHVLDEGAKELGVLGIPPACHVEDGPEEHWLGGVAFIGLFPAENREEGMEMLQELAKIVVDIFSRYQNRTKDASLGRSDFLLLLLGGSR